MTITVDDSAVKRIKDLRAQRQSDTLLLQVTVEGGGCSGFQYKIALTESPPGDKDIVFKDCVVTDDISLPFLKDATIRFEEGLIGSEFKIDNPNALSGCGCGTSFSVM